MSDKQQHQKKMKSHLDEWHAEAESLKNKAAGTSADAQQSMRKYVQLLENKVEEGENKLAQLEDHPDDAWSLLKDSAELAWDTLVIAVSEASRKFYG